MKLKYWRGFQAKSGWKGAPNGDLRVVVPERGDIQTPFCDAL